MKTLSLISRKITDIERGRKAVLINWFVHDTPYTINTEEERVKWRRENSHDKEISKNFKVFLSTSFIRLSIIPEFLIKKGFKIKSKNKNHCTIFHSFKGTSESSEILRNMVSRLTTEYFTCIITLFETICK